MNVDRKQIMACIPHRPPVLLLDRVEDLHPGLSGVGVTDISQHAGVFAGHFPGEAVMPGVLLVECMAQTAAVVFAPPPTERQVGPPKYLARIEKVTFKRPVGPGETLRSHIRLVKKFGILIKVEGLVTSEMGLAAQGQLLLYDTEAQVVAATQ